MQKIRDRYKFNEIIALISGITATMPIVTVPGTRESLFTIVLGALAAYNFVLLLMERTVRFKKNSISGTLELWLLFSLISSLFGYIFYYSSTDMSSWQSTVGNYIPKIIIYIILAISINEKEDIGKALIKGVLYGAIINCAVSIIDALCYYALGYSLINRIFKQFILTHQTTLSSRYNMISLAFGGVIRSGGLNYDPAHLGMLAPMVLIYGISKRKTLYIVLAFLSILASLSTTALVCSIIGAIAILIIQKRTVRVKPTKKTFLWLGISIVLIGIIIMQFGPYISKGFGNMANRINDVYFDEGLKGGIRVNYITNAHIAIKNQGFKMLTGTGFNTASEGYIKGIDELSFRLKNTEPFDMENTYLSYLFDLGFIGFAIYIYLLTKTGKVAIKYLQHNMTDYVAMLFAGVFATIMCGFFYHYTLFSCQLLILISAAVLYDENGQADNNE